MSGIDRSSGHIGASQATRTTSALKAAGGAAFSVAANVGTVAAGALGGPMAASAASAATSALRSGLSSGGGGSIGSATNSINQGTADIEAKGQNMMEQGQVNQMKLFELQQAVNAQSQQFNTLTNVQKSKHDAAMAAIQNTR